MGFVVDDQQAPPRFEPSEHPAEDEIVIFTALDLVAVFAQLAVEGGSLVAGEYAGQKLVVVGDDEAGSQFAEGYAVGGRQKIALPVVIAGFLGAVVAGVREQYLEPVSDGDARRDDEKVIAVARVVAVFTAIEVVVQNQAGHDHGLARTRGHFEGLAGELVVRVAAGRGLTLAELIENVSAGIRLLSQLVKPDRRLDGLLLGEKELLVRRPLGVVEPVSEEIASHPAADAVVAGTPPDTDLLAQLIDQMFPELATKIVQIEHAALGLLADGHLRNVGRKDAPANPNVPVIEIPLGIGRVMTLRLRIGRVQNRIVFSSHLDSMPASAGQASAQLP